MRLTLRSLLAYLDNSLSPENAADIAKKIEASEFATALVQRIRDVTRRLRVPAPKVDGRGIALDPNTMAEYLDNLLPKERVADFEKVCLESDMHLAEVASVHQILALVLGEPAEVDPAARMRMYTLNAADAPQAEPALQAAMPLPPATAPEPADAIAPSKTPIPPALPANKTDRAKPVVPEYLREPARSSSWGFLATAVAVVVLAGGGLFVGLKWDAIQGLFSPGPGPIAQSETPPAPPAPQTPPAARNDTDATENEPNTTSSNRAASGSSTTGADMNPAANVPATGAAPRDRTSQPETPATPPARELMQPAEVAKPTATSPAAGPTDTKPAMAAETPTPPSPPAPNPPMPTAPSVDPKAGPAPPVRVPVGKTLSEREVIVRFDAEANMWRRLAAQTPIITEDVLVGLPAFRPTFTVGSGLTVQLIGATMIRPVPPDARGVPGVELREGRVLLSSLVPTGGEIRVLVGSNPHLIRVMNDSSLVAIEVRRLRAEGADPEKDAVRVEVDAFVTGGECLWTDASNPQSLSLTAPAFRAVDMAPGVTPRVVPIERFPAWTRHDGDDRSSSEKLGAPLVELALPADRPLTLGLKEMIEDRKSEVRTLAAQSLALIGDFDELVKMLSMDGNFRVNDWKAATDALRAALARGPKSAVQVRSAFERLRGPQKGADLYRMLWGYLPERLTESEAQQLVRYLDHEDFDYRLLAIQSLQRLQPNEGTFNYRPQDTAAQRKQAVATWKKQADSGKLFGK